MTRRPVVFFCMPELGHFRRLGSLISGMSRRGIPALVFTHRGFRTQVERAGGTFVDLFSKYPLERADDESLPVPCRFVSFAGFYAEEILRDVHAVNPSLVIHDSFAVVGRVVAALLGIPHVNVCAGHNVAPPRFLALLQEDPRVRISPRCLRAVEALRARYGMPEASPFSYVSTLSSHLNVYCEPPAFLDEADRRAFEPVAFYGSLPSLEDLEHGGDGGSCFGNGSGRKLKVYVSFGTVVWRYYAAEALRALASLAGSFARMGNVRAVISLGGTEVGGEALAGLAKPNVSVQSYVDQWRVLRETDVFFTHHGLNSTHEAIFHRVPMISYPFFWDQPALAGKCQRFGVAIPLTDTLRGEVRNEDVHAALARLSSNRGSMQAALSAAHEWERAVMLTRASVLQRIVDLYQ
jgi:UDP:flavonoid glycosyltransferase YjiC (YdhE family)